MNGEYEQLIRDAFDGLGSYSKLANGFRLKSRQGQTCAVYFSGNAPGNAVEIGFAPTALAPLLGRTRGNWPSGWAASLPPAGNERSRASAAATRSDSRSLRAAICRLLQRAGTVARLLAG
ncbi:MAG: hypothetical protein AW08_03634 [Candidatus Accumulibacter adjunctus]|uniref:Uncharacterized protein n=1 Tax=Candidatus Accumulibacter adjunctus TaxID=1454001 RepID=A0A011NJK9_9PROT|nr:MAG: hypothetical protein AW08_03634 [Candidatus Accumulibacter adjunctus]